MAAITEFMDIFWSLVGPWQYLFVTLQFLLSTFGRLLQAREFRTIVSWNRLQRAWFGAFWAVAGPRIRDRNGPRITALLNGRVTQARIVDIPVTPSINGIVLDIGPGMGCWVDLYAEARASRGTDTAQIDKIYGVEPSIDAHAHLSKNVREAGLEDVYEIVPVGIQSLSSTNVKGSHYKNQTIEKGSVDCVVSLLCLCSIPEPEKNIAELYDYLKVGGRWYLLEHVRVRRSWPIRLYQGMPSYATSIDQYGN
jgi:SAM-dependent methyltransferase